MGQYSFSLELLLNKGDVVIVLDIDLSKDKTFIEYVLCERISDGENFHLNDLDVGVFIRKE